MNRLECIKEQLANPSRIVYSVPIGPKRPGESPIFRRPEQKNGLIKIPSHITSLVTMWDQSLAQNAGRPACEDVTFQQIDQMMRRVGSWIRSRGHKLFFLYALNSTEWTITDVASWIYGFINVPLYDTLGYEAFDHILKIT
jgi:long-subunit acyl-CoA synthetase (AMP-forming)